MRLLEQAQIVAGFLPVNLATNTDALRQGDWVSLAKYNRLAVVFYKGPGTPGEDPIIVVEQATDAAGSGAKGLPFATVHRKQGADLSAIGQWTETTRPPSAEYSDATAAEAELIWVVEFEAAALDTANGYRFVRAYVEDVGSDPQLGCLLYVLTEPRYPDAASKMAGALA